MNKRMIIAANWKMNKNIDEAIKFLSFLDDRLINNKAEVIIFPPYIGLEKLINKFHSSFFSIGAQNVFYEKNGAFTGEVSISMLQHIGVEHVIIGHSERRSIFLEDDKMINKKISSCLASGLKPILCIGETVEQRMKKKTLEVLEAQLRKGFDGISVNEASNAIIAYEPIWAIGTGQTANNDQIFSTHQGIIGILDKIFSNKKVDLPILYGGSVNDKNAKDLGEIEGVDGFLIGGASLDYATFYKIIEDNNI